MTFDDPRLNRVEAFTMGLALYAATIVSRLAEAHGLVDDSERALLLDFTRGVIALTTDSLDATEAR